MRAGRSTSNRSAASLACATPLEGSLRRTGNELRVNALLIDAATGATVWSDRFDGDWTSSAKLEDEITGRLARRMDLELTNEESRRAQAERPNNPDAVDLSMRGWSLLNQPLTRERVAQARDLFERALATDPGLPKALLGLAWTVTREVVLQPSQTSIDQLARADDAVSRALSALPDDAMAHWVKGEVLRYSKHFEAAIAEYETAISINRSLAPAYAGIAEAKIRVGRAEEAFTPAETAIRLSPRDPLLNIWLFYICHAHTHLAEDHAAIEWCGRSAAVSPLWLQYMDLASAYAWTGRNAEARSAVAKLLELKPNLTVDWFANEKFSDNRIFLAQYQRIVEGLRKAGLPEK
jgi:adenylate cyclase